MSFGMVGIVQGQTARLNVVNSQPPPEGDRTCSVELSFVDGMGNVLAERAMIVDGGHAAFLDVMIDNPDIRPGQRLQIRAMVSIDDPNIRNRRGMQAACSGLLATVEVFNSETGRNDFYEPGRDPRLQPAARPAGGPDAARAIARARRLARLKAKWCHDCKVANSRPGWRPWSG